ncbi:MAG: class I SAM-dependent methyltransferase [Roseiflexaceae bacterium]|nr:class I SAM-dependent methyltransferase [Roseiflexaceae bacterium]
MTISEPTRFERLQQRYRTHDLPWDRDLPPPEIIAAAEHLPPGRVLDLGCGTARASVFLAVRGWQADAIDFVPEAITLAEERVRAAGVADLVRLHVGSVTDLGFLIEPYDLAIDVGCMHGFEGADLQAYAAEVARLVRPDGCYLLFAHLREPEGDRLIGIAKGTIEALFAETFVFETVEPGITIIGELQTASAWYTLRRRG